MQGNRLVAAALLTFGSVALAGTAMPPIVEFPGQQRSVFSPDGSGARIFYKPFVTPDGSQASPVFFDDGRGNVRQVATLSRNMAVAWSPSGRHAFVQDNWGSNVSDCYILGAAARGPVGISLSKLIQKVPGHPQGAESPSRSHYYVRCLGWRSSRVIRGTVDGHTDSSTGHAFDHPFVYDVVSHRLTWLR